MLLFLAMLTSTPRMPLSVATTDDALAVFANPAGLGAGREFDLYYLYNFQPSRFLDNNTFVVGAGPLAGFWEPGQGNWGLALGVSASGFCGGARFVRDSLSRWSVGGMWRPADWLSLGGVWQDMNRSLGFVTAAIGVRPFGSRLTLFGEAHLDGGIMPVAGFEAEPIDGFSVAARAGFSPELNVTAGLTFGLGRASVGAVGTMQPAEYAGVLRLGAERRRSLAAGRKRYLDLKISGAVMDQKPGLSLAAPGKARTTWQLLDLLDRAGRNPNVRGILLRLDRPAVSLPHAQEIRGALAAFRARGKRVVVHGHQLGMTDYYIASVANCIVLHPLSDVTIPGVGATAVFLKGTLEKLGLVAEPSRHGKYKSAVETFTEDSLTGPNREQYSALVQGLYDEWVAGVAAGRSKTASGVESLVDRGFFMAPDAQAAGLVDTTCYDDQLDSILLKEFPTLARWSEARFRPGGDYEYDWHQPEATVAVIYASGAISAGESGTDFLTGSQNMGAQTMVRAIRRARKDRNVKAVVLRVDSPGGDGFASDLIWRELELCRKKKPLVVSMAELAASGGYYISCNAERVYALPTTLTGSIGVFSLRFVTEGLFNKLGIRRQSVTRGRHADMNDQRPMTPEEDSIVQAIVDGFYAQFIGKVAEGRGLSVERVDSVGQGRVWVGRDAARVGLVDSMGGLQQAIDYAKQRAGLKHCDIEFLPAPRRGVGPMLEEKLTELLLGLRFW